MTLIVDTGGRKRNVDKKKNNRLKRGNVDKCGSSQFKG